MPNHGVLGGATVQSTLGKVLECLPDPTVAVDVGGLIVAANALALELLGYTAAELVGEQVERRVPDLWRQAQVEDRASYFAAPRSRPMAAHAPLRAVRRDGSTVEVLISLASFDAPGVGPIALASLRDVSALRQTERELRAAKQRYRALFEQAIDGILLLDGTGRIIEASRRAVEITGREVPELLGMECAELLPAADRVESRRRFAELLRTGFSRIRDREIERPDGTTTHVDISNSRIEIDGELLVLSILTDASLRRSIEAAGRSSERRYRELFRNNAAGVFRASVDGDLLECNGTFARIFGYDDPSDLTGKPCRALYAEPAVRDHFVERLRLERSVANFEIRGRRSDGSETVVLVAATLVHSEEGEVIEGTLLDVGSERRAKAALAEAERQLRTVVESVEAVLYRADARTLGFTYVSPRAERWLGYPLAQWLEEPDFWVRHLHAEDREAAVELCVSHTAACRDHSFQYRMVRADGHVVWVHDTAHVLVEEGRPVELVGVLIDVTERRELEQQYQQAQKMEAVGRLAGGIAHDFNNLMSIVLGYTEMMLAGTSEQHPDAESLRQVAAAAERAVALTRQLLAFSRKQMMRPRVIDLNALLQNFNVFLRRVIGDNVALATTLADELWAVSADPIQVEQVLLNLAVNARDAMPNGGTIRIATSNVTLDDTFTTTHRGARAGRFVCLRVEDDGSGMDAETLQHVFEPFFTTKDAGRGTGLGLATVYGIVKQMEGYVDVSSEIGRGTQFDIYLPRSTAAPVVEARRASAADDLRGEALIMLVEDSEALRRLIARQLGDAGYRVLEAARPSDALALAREAEHPIDLLLTDIELPEMSGVALARLLRSENRTLRVLFMSGHSDLVVAGLEDDEPAPMQKPIAVGTLLARVRDALDASPPGAFVRSPADAD